MVTILKSCFKRYFSDPEAVLLFFMLVAGFVVVVLLGNILLPALISLVIAYLLQSWVRALERYRVPHIVAYNLVYVAFLAVFISGVLFLAPLLWRQIINLFIEIPTMAQKTKEALLLFIEQHPVFFSEQQINAITSNLVQEVQSWGKHMVSVSLSSIPGAIAWLVYTVLVPLLVFFFLKDKDRLTNWFVALLPKKHNVLRKVWQEMDQQIGNYIRGKFTEIIIVGLSTYIVFLFFGLNYRILLACLVGLSVVIPYVGAVVITIPVALVSYLQWGWEGGWTGHFAMLMYFYGIIQALDGNVLVPLLFSEAVNLHPIAIMVAILIFGALWGFWGIFFAIPLATLVKAVLNSWPKVV